MAAAVLCEVFRYRNVSVVDVVEQRERPAPFRAGARPGAVRPPPLGIQAAKKRLEVMIVVVALLALHGAAPPVGVVAFERHPWRGRGESAAIDVVQEVEAVGEAFDNVPAKRILQSESTAVRRRRCWHSAGRAHLETGASIQAESCHSTRAVKFSRSLLSIRNEA